MPRKLTDAEITLLMQVYQTCKDEDVAVRDRQLRQWRKLKLLWEGFSQIYYNEVAHDWRVWDDADAGQNTDQASYDQPINVLKAYLESIIAALSVVVPPVKCYPDDADNTLDLSTARAGDKIAQLTYRHNDAPLLWLHALYIFATEGMTACYGYPKSDEKYGTYTEKKYDEVESGMQSTVCPICGYALDEQEISPDAVNPQLIKEQEDKFEPDDDDAQLDAALDSGQEVCPACASLMNPQLKQEKFITTRLIGETQKPKSRVCLEVYGGLNVKIPNYARKQKDVPFLIFSEELDYTIVFDNYEHLHDNDDLKKQIKSGENSGGYTDYAQWARLSPQYQGEYPLNVVTKNCAWIRPARFNCLSLEDAKKLKKLFPDGVKIVVINEVFAEACNESLDDCWTLLENPMADYLHFEPAAQGLTSVQDITNELISLVLQTIEHGIGQTFADPAVVNFNAYAQTEVTPGGIFPAVPKSGKSLNDGFHELRTATLSPEVLPFSNQIQSLGQLASGALPSLFGGALQGSETASQYSMSRAQALQRQQNTWKMFTMWWKAIFGKVIPMHIDLVKEDERTVERNDDGDFINTFIRKADLEGKIGRVELEANENLPMTWGQKKDTVEKILASANPEILQLLGLTSPENLAILHESLGLTDWYVPGEDDVIKQYDEIKLLLASEPHPNPQDNGDGVMPEIPSIPVDDLYDNHQIEFEICRKWIISEAGRQTKIDNEDGYRNVLLHGMMHKLAIDSAQMEAAMQQGQGAVPNAKPDVTKTKEAPIQGESDVPVLA
jgi:hypothetical protein